MLIRIKFGCEETVGSEFEKAKPLLLKNLDIDVLAVIASKTGHDICQWCRAPIKSSCIHLSGSLHHTRVKGYNREILGRPH
uniref:Uncharacterized protein n=1 Tax=Salix viminalis TaxID=40686 RepID=A0A6N2M3E7_SALVM